MSKLAAIFTINYWFNVRTYSDVMPIRFMLGFFVVLMAAAVAIKVIGRQKKWSGYEAKLADKYFGLLLTCGIFGLIFTWFRSEMVILLSARFWMLLLAAAAAWRLYYIILYQVKIVPAAKKQSEAHKLYTKYLPKKK